MSRVAAAFQKPLRCHERLSRRTFARGDRDAELRAVRTAWELEGVKRCVAELDAIGVRPTGGRPCKYRRSSLFAVVLVALRLGVDMKPAYHYVKTSHELCALFGLDPDRFPSRQAVEDFLCRWLPEHGAAVLAALRRVAYVELIAQAIAEFDIDTTKLGIDCTKAASPCKGPDRERVDDGAIWIGRRGEDPVFGRLKHTAILGGDAPLVVASGIPAEPHSEQDLVKYDLIPDLVRYGELVAERVRELTGRDHDVYADALATGDRAFMNNPVIEALAEAGLRPGFEPPDTAEVIGRIVARRRRPRGHADTKLTFDIRSDGAVLCPCDRRLDAPERRPMRRTAGKSGPRGHFHVACENPTCNRRGERFYVSAQAPVIVTTDDGRTEARLYRTLTTALPAYESRVRASSFKCLQAIESHHSVLQEKFDLAHDDRRGRRRFFGQFAHELYYALGDLLWNLDVLTNLRAHGLGKVIEWDEQAERASANNRAVARRRSVEREARIAVAESAVNVEPLAA